MCYYLYNRDDKMKWLKENIGKGDIILVFVLSTFVTIFNWGKSVKDILFRIFAIIFWLYIFPHIFFYFLTLPSKNKKKTK